MCKGGNPNTSKLKIKNGLVVNYAYNTIFVCFFFFWGGGAFYMKNNQFRFFFFQENGYFPC